MNDGLQGLGPDPALPRMLEGSYLVYARTSLPIIATEPSSDTVLAGEDGNTPLECRFFLQAPRTVLVRVLAQLLKGNGNHSIRGCLYDNGVKVAPSTALHAAGWYSHLGSAGPGQHQLQFDAVLALDAGQHVLDCRHQAALGTSSTTFGERWILAQVVSA